jgi:hypothetical protein
MVYDFVGTSRDCPIIKILEATRFSYFSLFSPVFAAIFFGNLASSVTKKGFLKQSGLEIWRLSFHFFK